MKTRKTLVLSACHLSVRTSRFLSRTKGVDWPVPGGHYSDMGFFFHVVDENGVGPDFVPRDLFDVLEYARNGGFTYVLMEAGAGVCPELVFYGRQGIANELETDHLHKRSTQRELDAKKAQEAFEALGASAEFSASDRDLSSRINTVVAGLLERVSSNMDSSMSLLQEDVQHLADLAALSTAIPNRAAEDYSESRSALQLAQQRVSELTDALDLADEGEEARVYEALGEACYRLDLALAVR
ncbi:DUF5983 family protein [Rhizobium leguminosarum]|uniref:DUF5983 family protein n=1 Tax=Rhizobium leguminosarum TaxID=384 RepID=UPI003D055200